MKIICEAGCNWTTMEEAKLFIKESKRLELFATKFQLYNEDNIRDAPMQYQDFLRSIQLDYHKAHKLFDYGKQINQEVFFTPMFLESVKWISKIGCDYIKIRYKDRYNLEIIKECLKLQKPIVMSMDFKDTWELSFLYRYGIIPMFCIPNYPADIDNYLEIDNYHFHDYSDLSISDHTSNLDLLKICLDSERYFEKHMKLDNTTPLEDAWSVSFSELEEVLKNQRNE